MVSSGAMFSSEVKQRPDRHIPALAIADVLGSTEGGMGTSITTKDTPGNETAKFTLERRRRKVFTEDGREVEPGSGEIGVVANGGLVPIGLLQGSREVGADVPRGERHPLLVPRRHGDGRQPTARWCSSVAGRTASTPAARRSSPRRSRRR